MRIREKIYDTLKEKVLSGDFLPGQRLKEEHLAEALGVSRTPVREALHKLELEGLVKPLETRGFCVPQDSLEEMEQVFDIRAILEGYALRVICEIINDQEIQQLTEIIDQAEAELGNKNTEGVFKYNTVFHDSMYALLTKRNPRLLSMIGDMRKYVLRYRKDTVHYLHGARRTIDGHRKIILALNLRDPDLCERVMRQHVYESKPDPLEKALESPNDGKSAEDVPQAHPEA